MPPGTHAVVLEADSASLHNLEVQLTNDAVPHCAIRERDPPYNGALLAIGINPGDKKKLEKYTSTFPLVK